jgi:dethiobiotin synthetase
MNGLFVTGTDTAVGKTTVTAAIAAAATRRGLRVAVSKPVESGCERDGEGRLRPADAALLRAAAGGWQSLADVCPVALEAPLAPAAAAHRVGQSLDLAGLCRSVESIAARRPDLLLVEGAGGLLVPLGRDATVADLARMLGLPLLLVGRDGLGTINHTSLTAEAAFHRELEVRGIVLSASAGVTPASDVADNVARIERTTGLAVLGHLPRLGDLTLDGLAAAAERHLALDRLL